MLLALLRGGARPNTPPLPPSPAPARVSAPAPAPAPAPPHANLPGRAPESHTLSTARAHVLGPVSDAPAPPSQVLRALQPLIEKVGLESDWETLFARDGEAGVIRASLVRYPYEARPPRPPQRGAAS